jgi:hypothetical protein
LPLVPLPLRSCLPWLLVAALAPLACGHRGAGKGPRDQASGITVENNVTVRFSERLERFPFDPRELRLREASRQLAKLAGHPVAFDIDVALMPQVEASFHEALIGAIQSLARDLESLDECPCRAYAPRSIAIRYDATATEGRPYRNATYDRETAALSIPVHPDEGLVPEQLLREVLMDLRADDMVARFAGKAPAAVPAAEHRDYLEYLSHGWYDLQTGDRRGETEPDELRKLIALYEQTRDEALRADIRARLLPLARSSLTDYHWGHEEALAREYPPAIADYGGFLARHAAELSPAEHHEVAQTLYVLGDDRRPVASPPGFDAFAFALRIIDQWLAATAGHSDPQSPPETDAARELDTLFGFVACPYIPHSSHPSCRDQRFYAWAWGTPEGRERLAKALRDRDSLALTQATFQALTMAGGHEAVRELWRMLEDDAEAWAIGARVLGDDYVYGGHSPWVADDLERLWRERPKQRGVLLYLLARSDPDGRQDEIWGRRFARRFGASPSARDFEAFLDVSPLAMRSLGGVLKVLDASPVPAVLARLDGHLDAKHERSDGYDPIPVLTRHLCDDGTPAERAALHAHLRERLRDHASERPTLRHPLETLAPGGCE